jgi:hypothetical protein
MARIETARSATDAAVDRQLGTIAIGVVSGCGLSGMRIAAVGEGEAA